MFVLPVAFELRGAEIVQGRMHALLVIQLGREAPIKPLSEKYSIRGIHGMGSGYASAVKRGGAEERSFAACEKNSNTRPRWKYRSGCLTSVCAAR